MINCEARTTKWRILLFLGILAACGRGDEPGDSDGTVATDTGPAPVGAEVGEGEAPAQGERPSFAEAHMASAVDASRDEPDPATYTAAFPDTAAIYVVYRLQEGAAGRVTIAWKQGGVVLFEDEQTLPADGTWAFNAITPPPGGFPTGTYEVELRIAETGELRTLSFTVHSS
jgi:hypothetical protein